MVHSFALTALSADFAAVRSWQEINSLCLYNMIYIYYEPFNKQSARKQTSFRAVISFTVLFLLLSYYMRYCNDAARSAREAFCSSLSFCGMIANTEYHNKLPNTTCCACTLFVHTHQFVRPSSFQTDHLRHGPRLLFTRLRSCETAVSIGPLATAMPARAVRVWLPVRLSILPVSYIVPTNTSIFFSFLSYFLTNVSLPVSLLSRQQQVHGLRGHLGTGYRRPRGRRGAGCHQGEREQAVCPAAGGAQLGVGCARAYDTAHGRAVGILRPVNPFYLEYRYATGIITLFL